jgi:O-antigen chain-terminating methyltransferase
VAAPDEQQIIDVERLVEELRARVARERASGTYTEDLSGVALEVPPEPSSGRVVEGFGLEAGGPRIRFRPELGFSAKPVVGPVITLVKKLLLRLLFFVLDDLARQADAAVQRLEAALAAEAAARESSTVAERAAREAAFAAQTAAVAAEAAAREGAQADIRAVSQRADRIEAGLEKLSIAQRLARLERSRRAEGAPATTTPQRGIGAPAVVPPASGVDYLAFEARFRPEESVRRRQRTYVELLRGCKRVVDLGCGRGELIELLAAEGVSAYGVEIEPDFLELLAEKGTEVVRQDAVAHLAELEPGTVDGIVASHLVEHLPTASVSQLVALADEKLPDGGLLVLETPNPESLLAGSVNFHRDPTHVRPIHPDTLAFLCESAGFGGVEIQRLSPVPEGERLPAPEEGPLEPVVQQLNELLYGYQDYAVIARK